MDAHTGTESHPLVNIVLNTSTTVRSLRVQLIHFSHIGIYFGDIHLF
jgi:hypothetical protein